MSKWRRLGVFVSALWIGVWFTAYAIDYGEFKWGGMWLVGVMPVLLCWGIWWVVRGFIPLALLIVSIGGAGCSSSPTAPTPPPIVSVPIATTPVVNTPSAPVDSRLDLTFYRALAHNAFERPGLTPLRRWTRAPFIYLRTVDDTGIGVPERFLDQTAAAIINTTTIWTGGQFGVAGLERGTSTRAGQPGWLTVRWVRSGLRPTLCGETSLIGEEGAEIVLDVVRPECTCGPLTVKHELGHAMGFWHTAATGSDLMVATFENGQCDKNPSEKERYHAAVAYSRPVGSLDPS